MSYYKIRNSSANHGNNNNGNGGMTEGNNSIHNHLFGNHNNPLQEPPHHQNRKMSTASSFDVIRSTRSSDSFSSMFSGISPSPINRNNSSNPFTAHFEAINRLPLDHWLKVQRMPTEKEEDENEEMMDEEEFEETNESGNDSISMVSGLKALLSNLQLMQEQTDEQLKRMMEQLERMIVNDNGSGQQKRIHPQQKMHQMQFHPQHHQQQLFAFQPPKLTATMIMDEKENGERDQNGNGEEEEKKSIEKLPSIPLKLPSDPAHWLKKYPPPKQNRPMNEQAEDVSCWESVLGWKRILEKIHASGEHVWLAPSSRTIKN